MAQIPFASVCAIQFFSNLLCHFSQLRPFGSFGGIEILAAFEPLGPFEPI
jgi:hypothetical protein